MRKILLMPLLLLMMSSAFAQKYVPIIKAGTILNYTAHLRNSGQNVPILLTVKTVGDPTNIEWFIDGFGTGIFAITDKAQQTGTKVVIRTPQDGSTTRLKDDETFVTVSKSTYNSMVKNEPFELNGIKFTTIANDTTTYLINNKAASILTAMTADGKGKLCILNNPDFPLIYSQTMVVKGININLQNVRE